MRFRLTHSIFGGLLFDHRSQGLELIDADSVTAQRLSHWKFTLCEPLPFGENGVCEGKEKSAPGAE